MTLTGSSGGTINTPNEEDLFKILVATDIHLGYGEKNTIQSEITISFSTIKF